MIFELTRTLKHFVMSMATSGVNAFRRELVPQDPKDEPTADFLKRLFADNVTIDNKPRQEGSTRAYI